MQRICFQLEATGIKVTVETDTYQELKGEIRGPPDSPYEGGIYEMAIQIPEMYPFHPPKVRFITRIWHPNISSVTGAVCLDVLKDQWAASLTLRTVLLSIQVLLGCPEPNDPQDAVVARQMIEEPQLFRETARFWAKTYAKCLNLHFIVFSIIPNNDIPAPCQVSPEYDKKVRSITEMGVAQVIAFFIS
ncbi:ubiquitin conjugating enzyme E2 K [Trichuris trichiura]|uniref:Ubiquitin conjugating enzyme E2 K n=1 Tax=Trichuris trichiura TaxID=36087 RepID=A0A077ZA19_TRITR|nr:ubiquitin conjugating enzyme E2 K [Trichuris trichiura]